MLGRVAVVAGVVPDSEGAEASLRDVLAAALEANRELARLAGELRAESARLRAENAGQVAEMERLRADLAVLQRLVFGRSSERSRPEPPGRDAASGPGGQGAGTGTGNRRGPGARAGGGIARTCPGSRWSGISGAAGTAARSAGRRSRGWAAIM